MEVKTGARNLLENMTVSYLVVLLTTLLVGGFIILLFRYIAGRLSRSRQEQDSSKKNKPIFVSTVPPYAYVPTQPTQIHDNYPSQNKRKNKKRREAQQERTHSWMVGTLKGHTDTVCDVNFSSNGRYLASCAEDQGLQPPEISEQWIRGRLVYDTQTCDSTGMCSGTTLPSPEIDYVRDNRRQSRNRTSFDAQTVNNFARRHNNEGRCGEFKDKNRKNLPVSSPDDEETVERAQFSNEPITQGGKNMGQREKTYINLSLLLCYIQNYLLKSRDMAERGYPIELNDFPGCAIVNSVTYPTSLNASPYNPGTSTNADNTVCDSGHCTGSSPDVSDQESRNDNEKTGLSNKKTSESKKSSDSERSSESEKSSENESSDKGSDIENALDDERSSDNKESDSESDEKETGDGAKGLDSEKKDNSEFATSEGRKCVRCQKIFYVDRNGEYLCVERCVYHWGKMRNGLLTGVMNGNYWTCCHKTENSCGCTEANRHVWSGLIPGINGPFAGYVRTLPSTVPAYDGNYGIYSLDCEMCYTRHGLELTKVTFVDLQGAVVYDTLVKPSSEIIDYNTRFSGITEKHMANITKTLRQVQLDLLSFVSAETILMGHGLASDFRALRLFHDNVIDTTDMFRHTLGFPYCIALKTLAWNVLKRDIQKNEHDSVEDARVVVDLVLTKISFDKRNER